MFQKKQHTPRHHPNNKEKQKKNPIILQRKGENNFQYDEAGKITGMQRKEASSPSAPAPAKTETPSKTSMPEELRSGLENLSGEDLTGVRVHRNSSKPAEVQAHAYTQGEDIYLGPGQEKYLPHEGWHAVQQKQGRVQPTIQQKSALINDDHALEKEADVMGEKAVQMKFDPNATPTKKNRNATRNGVIQRAMKFEFQFKNQRMYRDNGYNVKPLPRKFGPRDYIMRSYSEARMETETGGQIEFETPWEKKWSKLGLQVRAIQNMANQMKNAPVVNGSDGSAYKKFPFDWALKHLKSGKGFSSSSGVWSKDQMNGKARVNTNKKYENIRSSAKYDSSGENIIGTYKNGTKVFINYLSTDRKWARISRDGRWGWMWLGSLTDMESKKYESVSEKGAVTDAPLGKNDKLLVKEVDSVWSAYIQTSESFKPEQFESYLKQHDTQFAPTLIPGTKRFLLDHNEDKVSSDESSMQKLAKEWGFIAEHNKLKNLLLMVAYYIEKGRTQSTREREKQLDGTYANTGPRGPAKYAFSLMSRTHFGSIFEKMTDKEKDLFTKMVLDKGILPTMGLTKNSDLFKDGAGTKSYFNIKVYDWLVSITKGDDLLSYQSTNQSKLPAAMGRFNLGNEEGKHGGLVRFETRRERGNFATIDGLEDYAKNQFANAATKRPRETGKGKTGLEL